jgi:phenylpropionate dioxygenase-like ring-hydroxylating dioxygenase large terminal subunit
MDRETQVALARRILDLKRRGARQLADAPYHNPVTDYTSRAQFALEMERFFRHGPIVAGLSGDAAPGEFFTLDVAGVAILVVRDADGTLCAFLNVCRHRGAQVASGRGHAGRGFTCPYHGWRYDLRGSLLAWSSDEGFSGLQSDAMGLALLPVAEACGLIFVRPQPGDPIGAAGMLSGIDRELGPFDLGSYHRVETRACTRAMNWKLVVDTFLEAYHVPYLHRTSLAGLFHGDLAVFDAFGPHGRLLAVRRSITALDGLPESNWRVVPHATILYCLFPNTVLISQQDHVELWQVFPAQQSPDAATMLITLYAPEPVTTDSAARHWKANMDLLVGVTNDEDFVAGEQIQRGFYTGAQEAVVYGRNEPALIHYHRMIRDRLGLS